MAGFMDGWNTRQGRKVPGNTKEFSAMSIYSERFETEYGDYLELSSDRAKRKALAPPDKHIPNKDEASLLRKIMSRSGMSEKEVRSVKEHRIQLANARKKGTKAKRSRRAKFLDGIMKSVTKELKLAKEHPLVQEEYRKRLEKAKKDSYFASWYY
jgi:hypothetical protein